MKLIREMPDLFRLVGRLPINSYFVREDDGLTLVDANLPGRSTHIVEIALRLELPIRRIVLTHAHMDHTGSLDAICELLPSADVFIGARESRLLEQNFTLDRTEPQKKIRGRFAPVKTQPGLLDPGDHVGSLRALSTPGHTPGHFSFFDERNGALLTGDAFQTAGGVAVAGDLRLLFPFSGDLHVGQEAGARERIRLAGSQSHVSGSGARQSCAASAGAHRPRDSPRGPQLQLREN